MRRCLGMAGMVATLCACASPIIQAEADAAAQRLAAEQADCRRTHKPDKPVTPVVRCTLDADLRWHEAKARSVGHPNLGFVTMAHSQILAAADRYDAGKTSRAEFDAEAQRWMLQINERVNADAVASMRANQAASTALISAGAAMMASPPPPQTIRCETFGNTTTCR